MLASDEGGGGDRGEALGVQRRLGMFEERGHELLGTCVAGDAVPKVRPQRERGVGQARGDAFAAGRRCDGGSVRLDRAPDE